MTKKIDQIAFKADFIEVSDKTQLRMVSGKMLLLKREGEIRYIAYVDESGNLIFGQKGVLGDKDNFSAMDINGSQARFVGMRAQVRAKKAENGQVFLQFNDTEGAELSSAWLETPAHPERYFEAPSLSKDVREYLENHPRVTLGVIGTAAAVTAALAAWEMMD